MSSAERSYYGGSFLTDDFREAIQRRLRELGGVVLIVAAGVAAFSAAGSWECTGGGERRVIGSVDGVRKCGAINRPARAAAARPP